MSAHRYEDASGTLVEPSCVECGSDSLDPVASGESGVYTSRCPVCGCVALYEWPEDPEQGAEGDLHSGPDEPCPEKTR